MRFITMIFSVFAAVVAAGCASNPNASLGTQCEKGLSVAYQELDLAKAKGLEGTVEYTKAAGLLSAAKIQYEFEKYPNCIDKVKRARVLIAKSKTGK